MAFEVPTPEGSGLPKETTVQKLNVNPLAQTPSQPAPSTDPLDNVDVPQHKESTDPLDNVDAPQKQSDPLDSAPTTGAKITSLSQSYQLKRTDTGGYQPVPPDDYSPDISSWGFNLNPDYQRTFNVNFDQAKKMLAAHKVAVLSNLDEGGQNMLRSALVADQSIPMPSQQLNVLTPRTPSKDIMESLRKSDEDFWGGVQNEVSGKINVSDNAPVAMPQGFDITNPKSLKLLVPGQKYNVPGTTGKGFIPGVKIWDGESFRPIPEHQDVSPKIIKGVLQELSGMDSIPAEQISSRLQDIRNDKKYEALVDAGYAPSIDTKLPKDIQTFLKSDEYLNRSFEDKKLYAKQLYMAHSQELAGMAPNDFYEDIKSTFTPELNATFLRQGASDNISAAQKVLSSIPKKQDPHSGLIYDDVDNPNYALASKAISNYSKIIDDNPADGLSQKYIKALAQNVGGIDPVINPLINAGDAIDLHRVIGKVKTSGEESLTPGEKVLFDSQAMINSYQNIARPDVMTQAIGGIPSAIGFMLSLGGTKGITEASTKLLGGYLSKGLSAATPAMVSNLGETLKAIKDVAPSLQKVADYSIGVGSKLSSGAAEVTVQTMIARNAAVLTSTLHDIAGDPTSSFTYDTANKTTEISTPNKDGVKTTLLKRALMEAVNLGAFKVAGKLTQFQDAALLRLVDKYPAADKWLNYLYTQNAFESMQKMGMKIENPLAIGSIIRKLDVPSVPAEFVALQFIPARINALIKGDNSDELMSNFPVQIKKDLVGFAGLALVSGLGRLTSIAQGIYLAKVTYANEFRMMDFMNKVYSPTDIEFHHPDYQADLNKIWQNLYRSRDRKNITAAELMRAHVEIRKAFDNNEIDGINKDNIPTAKDYMEQCAASQSIMNEITDDIKSGNIDLSKIKGAIDNAPDDSFKQQFQFYLDMVNSYSRVSTGETLKQFIDKYKKEYQAIKDDLLVTDMMKTAPNWEVYKERIAVLPLPQTYKDECLSILNNVYTRWKDERDSHIIATDRKDTPMYFRVDGKSSHSLSMNPYGKYSLVSTNVEDFIADATTSISKMNNENLSELFNIVQNSDLNPEQKSKLNESIKERLLLSFKDTEFLTDIGGAKNFVELISMANDLQLASPFTVDEKQQLTLSIGHILSNEIKKEFSPENIEQIKSVLQTCMQYLNVFKPADIMDLTKFIYKQAIKVTIENASNTEITSMASEGDKDAIEELDFRTRNGFLNEEEKKLALEMLNGKDIKVGKDFDVLASSNKYVKRLDVKLQELVTQGRISENDRFVLQGIISLQSMEHFKFNRIELQKTTDENAASYYNPASKGLVIQYTENTPSWQIVGEMSHEIIHMAHHNIALSLGRGGIGVGDFVMDERTINEIAGSNRADVVANMARWYQGKEYSYDRYLELYKLGTKRNPSERAEYDAIVNMLDWYRNHFNQADRNNMEFIDDINKDLKWNFTTESLVKNFNRWTEMRKAGYSPARAHYYSAYMHESVAELMSNRNIKLVANRISGDMKMSNLIENVSDWTSKNIKVPILQRLYRSTIFDSSDAKKYLNTLVSQRDVDNMMKISTTPDECANDTIKDELDNISGNIVGTKREGIPPLTQLRKEYRKIIEQGNPQLVEDLYDHILTTIKHLGYDSSMLSDLIGQINKDANLINAETIEPTVLRHGDTEEVMNQISDSPDEPLDELGIAQAKQYGEQFLMDGITTVYCSNMKRNMETAVEASKVCGADVKSNPLFRTMDTGDFTGFPEAEFDEKHYVDNPDEKIPGGESFNDFLARCIEAKKIKDSLDGKSAIISNSKMIAVWQALDDNAQVWNDDAKKDYLEREDFKGTDKIGTLRDSEVKYVSNTWKSVSDLKIEKTSGAQWETKILSSGGKLSEMKRYGLDELLKDSKSITKQDILDFLSDKVMKVKDVILSDKLVKEDGMSYEEINRRVEESRNNLKELGFDFYADMGGEGDIIDFNGEDLYSDIYYLGEERKRNELYDELKTYGFNFEKHPFDEVVELINKYVSASAELWEADNGNVKPGNPRYSSYTSFPLKNYRELLPVIEGKRIYSHRHFPGINNQLYHNRISDWTTESGKTLLGSEELQSDWTQDESGDIGLKNLNDRLFRYEEKLKSSTDENEGEIKEEINSLKIDIKNHKKFIEDSKSPLKTTSDWMRPAIMRMIKMAVDEGKDGIAWTPAHMQVERWSSGMRDVVDKIDWNKSVIPATSNNGKEGETKIVVNSYKNGSIVHQEHYMQVDGKFLNESGHELKETYGNEIAKQIIANQESGKVEGDKIIVGGEGYKDVYDRTAVDIANKIGKKYGIKVTSEDVKTKKPTFDALIKDVTNPEKYQIESVHAFIFTPEVIADFKKKNELLIHSNRAEATLYTGAFKNLHDLIDNSNKADELNRIGSYAGLKGLDNIRTTDPKLYKELRASLDSWKRIGATNSMENFLKYGFFMETLGKKFEKFEISDKDMRINKKILDEAIDVTKDGTSLNMSLGDFITHKNLFNAYPDLKSLRLTFYNNPKAGEFGFAQNKGIGLNLAHTNHPEFHIGAIVIHELQHKIQDTEEWWRGGNPEMFKNKLFLYNTYMLYKSGDPEIRKIINSNDYHEIRAALGDISNGIEPKAKDEMFLDTKYSELMNHVTSTPEYRFAHALYESLIGERESTDVANRYRLPSVYKMVEPVTMALSMASKPQAIPLIGSMRAALDINPVDAAWFADLFTNKDGKVSKDDLMRLINDINDNFYKYGQSTKIAKQLASQHARSMVDMWKARLIQTETPKISKYDREELLRLLNTPVRKNILDYEKDVNFIEKVMIDSNYRSAFDAAKKQQQLARNRFARNNKDNVNFYMAVRRLTSINLKMFDTPDKLSDFSSLISTRIENVNVKDFIKDADKIYAEYIDWKKQYNDQYKTGTDTSAKDSTPLEDAMMGMRRDLAVHAIGGLVNAGESVTDKKFINEFASIDVHGLSSKDFEQYEERLHELLNNPTEVDHKLVQFVDKQKANDWFDKASQSLSKKYIDILNDKSMPSDVIDIITDNITGSLPLIQFPKLKREGFKVKITGWHDKLGNISAHNLATIFDALEGFPKAQVGMLNSEIRQPLDAAYKQYLSGVASATDGLSPVGKFNTASMHIIGMHGLLNQLPDFVVSASTLRFLHDQGIDIEDIGTKQVLSHNETDTELKAAYDLINKSSKDMIKDSILISFGLKPDANWSDKEIEAILNDTSVMSRRGKKEIQAELDEILKDTGVKDLHTLIDSIIDGTHQLSPDEKSYLDKVYQKLSEVRNGDHSNGITLKDAAEKYGGTQFLEIPNYFPMIRYKTYLTAKTYFDPNGEESNDAKIFHGIYSDFNMNTAFLTQRKPAIMSLNTNAYDAVRKRIDDQVFYLNHIDQQTYLYDVFRTPFFNGDNATFNTNLSNHIIGFLNMYFNRGIDSERALMYKSPTGRWLAKKINNYRAFVLGNPVNSFKILSAAVFSMSKLEGGNVTRLQNMKDGVGMMTNSYVQGTPEEKFLRENSPEVYMRGMATYDISTYENEMHNTEGGVFNDFLPGKVKGVLSGLSRGVYQTESGAVKNTMKELFSSESSFGADASLAGIVWNHRIAARTAFFALYKNYCDSHNVPVDFESPNQDALTFANEGVRATQNTDNPIQRTGIQSGLTPGDSRWWGQFNSLNLLAFKSFAINERSTLMQANERMVNAIHERDWDEASHQAKYFAYSFMSKFLFNLIKLQSMKITAAAAAYVLTDPDSRKESYDRSIDAKSSLGIMAFKTILDYFTFNEVMKWGVSFAAEKGYEKLTDDTSHELDKGEKKHLEYTRDPIDGAIVSGQIGDIIDNMSKGTQTVATDYKKYGLNETTDADAARMALFIYSLGVNNIPGASSISDIIREMDAQRKDNDKAAKEHYESPLKSKSAGGNGLKGSKP